MSHPVLISGGSGGIGSALCLRFSAAGYTPYVGYARNREAAEQTARRCAGVALALDLTDDSAIDAALAKIVDAAPDLAGVVLAASPPPRLAPLAQISSGEMESAWRVGVSGPQRLLAGLVRDVFRKTRRGTIVGVLSEAMGNGRGDAMKGMGAYTVAKFGLSGLLTVLAADYSWLNVRSISPGFTETPMLAAFDPRFIKMVRQHKPFRRADDVAEEIFSVFENSTPDKANA